MSEDSHPRPEYSEATRRVLDRALSALTDKLSPGQIEQLRSLVERSRLEDVQAIETILQQENGASADR